MDKPQSRGASESLIGPVRKFGRYTLIKKLATGGMAEIWLARQRGLAGFNRFVVIKKILSHLSEQQTFVDMFLDEARTSAQLNHPNVVQIYDLGKEGDAYFIAMEFIAGENLSAIAWRGMNRGLPLSAAFAARVIADACKALHYAHHLRGSDGRPLEIVHRDVSPQNILVTYDGEVKVVDFGIAKAATKSEQTKTGMLKGKFSYMSPEQCMGAQVDMRSDIFALGILLYELCTGRRLFKHESELMILEMITKRAIAPVRQVAPEVPLELERIVMKALKKDVAERHQTAQGLQAELEAFLRTHEEPTTNADVARYLKRLFADRIEEKRRLRELASRDDFEERFGVEADDDEARPRRVVHGPSPSQIMVSGVSPPSQTRSAGAESSLLAASSSATRGSMYGTYGGSYPESSSWLTRLVILGALVVIGVAGTILVSHRSPEPSSSKAPLPSWNQAALQPKPPLRTGEVTIDSVPAGATIVLDGKPMPLGDGTNARTPSDVGPLVFGRSYELELRLKDHRPFRQTIDMSEETAGQRLVPTLEAFPGRLMIVAEGPSREAVRLFVDDQEVGRGPSFTQELPAHASVRVRAELPDMVCAAEPPEVRIQPNRDAMVAVRCKRHLQKRRTTAKSSRRPRPVRAVADPPPKPRGCASNPDLPPGFVTIDTRPYSEIFWGERRLGETPLARVRLPAGCVELEARSGELTKTFKVAVEPNGISTYRFKLE